MVDLTESEKELVVDNLWSLYKELKNHIDAQENHLTGEKLEFIAHKRITDDISECSDKMLEIEGIIKKLQA